jgi:hypothetical protein
MAVHMGYIGSARIVSSYAGIDMPVFLTGSSINPVQNINAPDVVQGQIVKHLMWYGPIEIGGNITGPIAENHKSLFDAAWNRKDVSEATDPPVDSSGDKTGGDHMAAEDIILEISYYRSAGRKFNQVAINSYEITVTAGDVANFTVDFMGAAPGAGTKGVEGYDNLNTPSGMTNKNFPAECLKLVTWDRCSFSIDPPVEGPGGEFEVQAFTFTVNNNLQRVYKIDTSGTPDALLYPLELVAGFRDMTGTVTVFAEGGAPESLYTPWDGTTPGFGAEGWAEYDLSTGAKFTVALKVGVPVSGDAIIDKEFGIFFRRPEASARTDVQVYTLNYQILCSPSFTS